jgi:hypothetical protein
MSCVRTETEMRRRFGVQLHNVGRLVTGSSADRRNKGRAMHDKFSGRIETALVRLAARIARSSSTAIANRSTDRSAVLQHQPLER